MGGAQPDGGDRVGEGAQDEASAAGGKPTQGKGGAGSAGESGQQQEGNFKTSAGSGQANGAGESAQCDAANAGQGVQDAANNIAKQFQGKLPDDSEGHLNNTKDAANSVVSILAFLSARFFFTLVNWISITEIATPLLNSLLMVRPWTDWQLPILLRWRLGPKSQARSCANLRKAERLRWSRSKSV